MGSRSVRSKGHTPSGSRRATASCSTVGRWSSAGSRGRWRAPAAGLGRQFGRDLALTAADLGWAIRLPAGALLDTDAIARLVAPEGLADDVLEGLDRGDLLARRFRHVAGTAMMVLRHPEGG